MAGKDEQPHALVVPASGQGHVNGCMLLATSLAALGFRVSFVYFSSYYSNLLKASKEEDGVMPATTTQASTFSGPHSITFHVVQDGFTPADLNMPFPVTPVMKEGLLNLILQLHHQGSPPTCLISDSFVPWTYHIAATAGIPRVEYWTSTAMSYLLIINASYLFSQGIFPEKGSRTQWKRETPLMLDHILEMPLFSSELYPHELRFSDPSYFFVKFCKEVASSVKFSERVLIHSVDELEPTAFQSFRVAEIPAYAIGPLLPHADKKEAIHSTSEARTDSQAEKQPNCMSWLDLQAVSSVIYIAFGSQASLSVAEIQELALGLEASGNPFLWVLREDSHSGAELSEVLPDGFLERTSQKGLIIIGWAPQVEVLAHGAVGGFFSHCGWNSTLESLCAGVPMLCCPRFAEQRSNSHYICNVWKVGMELERTEEGGLERSFVERGVKALMQDADGQEARCKAEEVMLLAKRTRQKGGQSMANLQKFYDDMKVLCSNVS